MFHNVIFNHDQNQVFFLIFLSSWFMFHVKLQIFILIKIEVVIFIYFMFFFIMFFSIFVFHIFMIHVSENNHQFSSFTYSVRTNYKKWSWWNFFIKTNASFFIIMYSSHVLHSYFFHLIRSLNHMNFMFHFMSLIKSTKYRFFLFSTIVSCDDNTYLLIRLFFENHNKLMWNVKWTFISDDNSSLYAYEFIFCLIINYSVNF